MKMTQKKTKKQKLTEGRKLSESKMLKMRLKINES